MKKLIAVLITAFLSLLIGQTSAATRSLPGLSIESLNASLICQKENEEEEDDEKKKKKKKFDDIPEEKEPECD